MFEFIQSRRPVEQIMENKVKQVSFKQVMTALVESNKGGTDDWFYEVELDAVQVKEKLGVEPGAGWRVFVVNYL